MTTSKVRIPHIEDLIFEGANGIGDILSVLSEITDPENLHITAKWDGAPAIICGQHPDTNRFFVSTKSFWNIDSKVNYTVEDITKNHPNSIGLQAKLRACLEYLPELNIKGILQGDMMYERSDLYTYKGNLCFQPNVIKYEFPLNSPLAQRMMESKIGIVFHTSYGPLMEANYKIDIGSLNLLSKNVWFRDASIELPTFSMDERYFILNCMHEAYKNLQLCNQAVINKFHVNEALKTLTKKYINDIVRRGKENYIGAPAMHHFIVNKMSDSIGEAVKPETKLNRQAKLQETEKWFKVNRHSIEYMCNAYNDIVEAKEVIMNKLNDGTVTEGYVISTPGIVVKLIDRAKFSFENFNDEKEWKQ